MAKLHFYYSAMNAGKSTLLLQAAHNYNERGIAVEIFLPAFAQREKQGFICSRIGIEKPATLFNKDFDFYSSALDVRDKIGCILIDEAQFLTKKQVYSLAKVVDKLNIPVLCYGLRTDYMGQPFEGSVYLLSLADQLIELKTICFCGKKASMNMRVNEQGQKIQVGKQVEIGGNDKYTACCRKHFYQENSSPQTAEQLRIKEPISESH